MSRLYRRLGGADARLLTVLAVALLVRVVYLGYYAGMPDWDQLTVDNYYHHHWAQSIAGGNIFGETTYFRAPFYVYCLGLLYALFGTSLWVGRLFGLAVGLASVTVTYLTGKRMFNPKVGLAAALAHSLCPVAIYFEGELLLDSLFTLLLQLTVYSLVIWFSKKTAREALMTGLILGLASITRPTALIFVPVFVLLLTAIVKNGGAWFKHSAVFVLGASLVIAPVFARNLLVAGDPVLISSQGGLNLYIGNNGAADGVSAVMPQPLGHNWRLREITHLAEEETGKALRPGDVSSFWAGKAVGWIRTHPGEFIKLYVTKLYRSISNREIANNRDLGSFFRTMPILRYNPLSFGILFALALAGIMAGLRRHFEARLLTVIVLAYVALTALFFFNSRFRLPLLPYYSLLAAFGLFRVASSLRTEPQSSLLLLSGAALGAFLSLYPVAALPPGASPTALTAKGLYYYAQEDYPRAMYYYRHALAVDSTFPENNLNIGACYFKLGLTDSARYYFEREKRFHPERAGVYTNIASLYLVDGRYNEAMLEAQKALARKPYDITANRVLLRAASGSPEVDNDSLAALAFQAADNTADDVYLLNEAAVLLSSLGDWPAAETLLWRALSAQPPAIETDDEAFTSTFRHSSSLWKGELARANYQLGYLLGLRGRYGEAVRHSSLAIMADPSLTEAYVNLVSGLLSLGRRREAESVLTAALGRFPDNDHLQKLRYYMNQ